MMCCRSDERSSVLLSATMNYTGSLPLRDCRVIVAELPQHRDGVLAGQTSARRPDLRPTQADERRKSQVFVEDGARGSHCVFRRQLRISLDEPRRSAFVELHAPEARRSELFFPERGRLLAECSLEPPGELVVISLPASGVEKR